MPVTGDAFRLALGRFASGVTVVTTGQGAARAGLTVSAFSSLSLNPPYVLICIDKLSSSCQVIRDTGAFVVNILASDQEELSNRFASRSEDKFAQTAYHVGSLGLPVLDNTLGHLECKLVSELDGGDHFIYLGQVEVAQAEDQKEPLLYYHGKYRTLK